MAKSKAKVVYSLLGNLYRGKAEMRPLPPEQRDTEAKKIERERNVAKISRKNYLVLARSWLYVEHPELAQKAREAEGTARTKKISTKRGNRKTT